MEFRTISGSKPFHNPAVDFFSLPPTDMSVISSYYQQVYPGQADKNSDSLTFRIDKKSSGNQCLDMQDSFIYIRAKIKRQDGSNLTADDKVAPTNLFLHTMFRNVNVKFNGTTITDTACQYPYQAWMSKQLKNGFGMKNSEMTQEFYYNDTEPDDYSEKNTGYQKRLELTKGSKQFEMLGRICDDVFELPRYVLNNIVVDIELSRSLPQFCLSGPEGGPATDYIFDIQDACFYIRRKELSSQVMRSIKQNQSKGKNMYYSIQNIESRISAIQQGAYGCQRVGLFQTVLPSKLYIGFVSTRAFYGNPHLSPFNFKHYNLIKLCVTVNGMPVVYRMIECNYDENEYLVAYNTLKKASSNDTDGNNISISDYLKGNVIYVFDIASSVSSQFHPEILGEMSLDIQFSKPLPEDVQIVTLGQFQSLIEIDKAGYVYIGDRGQ